MNAALQKLWQLAYCTLHTETVATSLLYLTYSCKEQALSSSRQRRCWTIRTNAPLHKHSHSRQNRQLPTRSQNYPPVLLSNANYRFPANARILSHLNPIDTFRRYSVKIHINIILLPASRSFMRFSSFRFPGSYFVIIAYFLFVPNFIKVPFSLLLDPQLTIFFPITSEA